MEVFKNGFTTESVSMNYEHKERSQFNSKSLGKAKKVMKLKEILHLELDRVIIREFSEENILNV